MKHLKFLILHLFVLLSLVACSDEEEDDLVQNNAPAPSPALASTPSSTPSSTPDPIPDSTQKVSASLSWDIPDSRENGERLDLSSIGGYEIIYRPTTESVYEVVLIDNQNSSQTVIEDLDPGEYEFLIAAFDSEGIYSDYTEPSIVVLNN